MGVRALQARVLCDRSTLVHLWRTHRVFNERIPKVLSLLFKMRRGELGSTDELRKLYQEIALFALARNSRDAPYLLNSVSIRNWKPNTARKQRAVIHQPDGQPTGMTGDSWADRAAALSASGQLLYDKKQLLGDLPDTLGQMVVRECVAIISGHDELVRRWEKDHKDWLAAKQNWEADPEHQKYLALRNRFEGFEQSVGGKVGKRRGRWHLYLKWLRENPDLAAWCGGPAGINEPTPEALERVKRAKPWKKASVEAEEFWKANPELRELDKLHGYYEREFIRRRKTKKNPDGFDHRPTFTLPHPVRHPRWYVFNAPQTSPTGYLDLKLPRTSRSMGCAKLRLLTGKKSSGEYSSDWVEVRIKADPRLLDFRAAESKRVIRRGAHKGEEKDAQIYMFLDRQLKADRTAQISGAKLMFKNVRLNSDGALKSADPHLVFTCDIRDVPLTENARKIQWSETGEVTKTGKKRKKMALPEGLVTCAVDLGIRNLGFATLSRLETGTPRILRSRNIWMGIEEKEGKHPGRWSPGPDLAHLAKHKREIRTLRQLRGKPVKGEESHIELQAHITHMSDDRFKKAARAIINFALNTEESFSKATGEVYPRADVLVLERLKGFIPDAERGRGINRALVEWNRGQTVKRVREMAKDVGLKVFEVSPAGTSQVCCRCGALGRRYSIGRDEKTAKPQIRFGWVEKLFTCAECGYRANADHNASVNLHQRFVRGEQAVTRFFAWANKSKRERDEALRFLEEKLRKPLEKLHALLGSDEAA